MKLSATILLLALVSAVLCGPYKTPYDSINIDNILKSSRTVDSYVKCLLDKGPCAAPAKTLKDLVPKALKNGCAECTEKQRNDARKVIDFLQHRRPQDWQKLVEHYDKNGVYRKRYHELLFGTTPRR